MYTGRQYVDYRKLWVRVPYGTGTYASSVPDPDP
jgi:hypothetical protein